MDGPSISGDTDAQRRARRAEQQRKRRQAQRASVDPEVTARLQAQAAQKREYMRYRRLSETNEQRAARRAAETEEQRAERRRADAEAAKRRRAEETDEQRQRRLDADRYAKRVKRMKRAEQQLRDHAAATEMFVRDFRENPFGYWHHRDLNALSEAVIPTLDSELPDADFFEGPAAMYAGTCQEPSKPSAVSIKEAPPCVPIAPVESGGEVPCLRHGYGQLADQLTCVPVGVSHTMLPCTCGKALNGTSTSYQMGSETTTTIKTEPEESAASDEEFFEMPLAIEMGIGEEPCNPPAAVKDEPLDIPAAPTENAAEANEILGVTGIESLVHAAEFQAKEDAEDESRTSTEEARSTCLP